MHQIKLEVLLGKSGVYVGDLAIYTEPIMTPDQRIVRSPAFEAVEEANRRLSLEYAERFVDLFQGSFISTIRSRKQRTNLSVGYVTRELSKDEIARLLSKAGLYPDVGTASTDLSNALKTDFTYVTQRNGEELVRYTWVENSENHKFKLYKSLEKFGR